MKLHHTVNHQPQEEIVEAIKVKGIIPQVADVYKDLVPEEIRHLPVVWLAEGIWQSKELPVFEVDTANLDRDKLYPNAVVYDVDETLNWWVYQGEIAPDLLKQITESLIEH